MLLDWTNNLKREDQYLNFKGNKNELLQNIAEQINKKEKYTEHDINIFIKLVKNGTNLTYKRSVPPSKQPIMAVIGDNDLFTGVYDYITAKDWKFRLKMSENGKLTSFNIADIYLLMHEATNSIDIVVLEKILKHMSISSIRLIFSTLSSEHITNSKECFMITSLIIKYTSHEILNDVFYSMISFKAKMQVAFCMCFIKSGRNDIENFEMCHTKIQSRLFKIILYWKQINNLIDNTLVKRGLCKETWKRMFIVSEISSAHICPIKLIYISVMMGIKANLLGNIKQKDLYFQIKALLKRGKITMFMHEEKSQKDEFSKQNSLNNVIINEIAKLLNVKSENIIKKLDLIL